MLGAKFSMRGNTVRTHSCPTRLALVPPWPPIKVIYPPQHSISITRQVLDFSLFSSLRELSFLLALMPTVGVYATVES